MADLIYFFAGPRYTPRRRRESGTQGSGCGLDMFWFAAAQGTPLRHAPAPAAIHYHNGFAQTHLTHLSRPKARSMQACRSVCRFGPRVARVPPPCNTCKRSPVPCLHVHMQARGACFTSCVMISPELHMAIHSRSWLPAASPR